MAMTKERLAEIKTMNFGCDLEPFQEQAIAELIAEVERLQAREAEGPFEKEWPVPFREEEIQEAKDVATKLWSMGPSVQGPVVRVIAKLEQLIARRSWGVHDDAR